jgi:DNA segregation ATPase FtsK/SpoIIIE-like protein
VRCGKGRESFSNEWNRSMTEQQYSELEPLYEMAKTDIPSWDVISINSVQRRYQLGYNRAARLLETLAEHGHLRWDKRTGAFSAQGETDAR